MAPLTVLSSFLVARQNSDNGLDNDDDDVNDNCGAYGCYSTWDSWGRWVALVVIIVAALLVAFAFSCINTRRRRRRGMAPMYGTGWMAGKPPAGQQYGYGHAPYYGPPQYNQPAPPYSPPAMGNQTTGNTFHSNDGYYGHHGDDFELQQPQSSYQPQRGGDPVYDAPQGPPPSKKGDIGIIR